ncbi:MAG: hypothetical protein ACI93T_000760, partial [Porticoccaceae bacterium]
MASCLAAVSIVFAVFASLIKAEQRKDWLPSLGIAGTVHGEFGCLEAPLTMIAEDALHNEIRRFRACRSSAHC